MRTHFGFQTIPDDFPDSVVCLGAFDGVHQGHRVVLSRAVERAHADFLPCVVLTFDRHPMATLAPDREPKALCTLPTKVSRIHSTGVDVVVVAAFDQAFSQMTAEEFFTSVVVDRLRARAVVVGHDFAFGKGRQGTAQWLSDRIETLTVPPYEIVGERVSSTAIRAAISRGDVTAAREMLGAPHEIEGVVVAGRRLGRTLGYPTANLCVDRMFALPADGIYVVDVELSDGDIYRGALSIGMRPTVGGKERTVEVFLINFPGQSLYGRVLQVRFLSWIREELRFDSLDELKVQMAEDVQFAKEYR